MPSAHVTHVCAAGSNQRQGGEPYTVSIASRPSRGSSDITSTRNGGRGFSAFIMRRNPGRFRNSAPENAIVNTGVRIIDRPALAHSVRARVFDLARDGFVSSATLCSVLLRA